MLDGKVDAVTFGTGTGGTIAGKSFFVSWQFYVHSPLGIGWDCVGSPAMYYAMEHHSYQQLFLYAMHVCCDVVSHATHAYTVHDTENLTLSAVKRAGYPLTPGRGPQVLCGIRAESSL